MSSTPPPAALLVVYCDPCDGRDAEFNDWYSHVHIRDVMRIPGSKAVQRFVRSDPDPRGTRPPGTGRYLAIYEILDVEKCIAVHLDDVSTDRMPISDALDTEKSQDTFYVPLDSALDAAAAYLPPDDAGLVLIAFDALAGRESEIADWHRNTWLPAMAKAPGLGAGHLYVKSAEQLMEMQQRRFLGIYQVANREAAVKGLTEAMSRLAQSGPVNASTCELAHYLAIIPRLTAVDVLAASAEQRQTEQRARAALGDRRHRFSLREVRRQLGMA